MNTNKSTYYVKNINIETLSGNKLPYYVKSMKRTSNFQRFAQWMADLIGQTKFTQKEIAEKAGARDGSFSRWLGGKDGSGIKKVTAIALIEALNEKQGEEIANKNIGLALWADIVLPDAIAQFDYSVFNADELNEIAAFIKFKQAHKTQTKGSAIDSDTRNSPILDNVSVEEKYSSTEDGDNGDGGGNNVIDINSKGK